MYFFFIFDLLSFLNKILIRQLLHKILANIRIGIYDSKADFNMEDEANAKDCQYFKSDRKEIRNQDSVFTSVGNGIDICHLKYI